MKRVLAVLLIMCTLFAIGLTGCKQSTTASKTQQRYKIGIAIWGTTDALGGSIKKYTDYLSKNFNCDFVYKNSDTPADELNAVENLVAAGCNGVLICSYSDTILRQISQTCSQSKVYFGLIFRTINDTQIKTICEANPYYIGNAVEDDYMAGYNMGKALAADGCKNVVVVSPMAPGDSCHDNRYNGAMKAIKETGMNKIGEYRNSVGCTDAIENLVASLPSLDGIILTGGVNGTAEACFKAVENHKKVGKIKVASMDVFDGAQNALKKNEIQFLAGGQFEDPAYMFAVLYNKLDGTPLSKAPVSLKLNFIQIKSTSDYDNYSKYIMGDVLPYTADEIKQWIKKNNSAATVDTIKLAGSAYSLNDVITRHKNLVK